MTRLGRMMITAFGLGYLRPAPGTWGSLPPVVMVLMLLAVIRQQPSATIDTYINIALVVLASIFAVACLRFGRQAEELLGQKDPGTVVADEVCGQSIALLALPWEPMLSWLEIRHDILLAFGAFIAFRLMDILKPPPARQVQRVHGGAGILIDDIIAGVYALMLVKLVLYWMSW
jgi:phosphatidylglycerophosphatase A